MRNYRHISTRIIPVPLFSCRKFSYKPDEERLIKPLSKEFDEFAVKTGEEDIPALPSYITESLSDNYYLKSPKREYIHIKAVNSEGIAFENTDMVAQLVSKQENFYFFDNNVPIMNKSFISPLSRFGLCITSTILLTAWSLIINTSVMKSVSFQNAKKIPYFMEPSGSMTQPMRLKRISVEIGKKAELNFIQRIKIQQEYEPV